MLGKGRYIDIRVGEPKKASVPPPKMELYYNRFRPTKTAGNTSVHNPVCSLLPWNK